MPIIKSQNFSDEMFLKKKRKIQIGNHLICIVLAILLLIGLAVSSNDIQKHTFATLTIGITFLSILFTVLIEIKNALKSNGRVGISIINILCWLFIIIPLGVLLPCTMALNTNDKSLSKTINIAIGLVGFVCFLGVSISSVIFNSILKRMEAEKRAKYVVEKLKKGLRKIAVKSDETILRLIYEKGRSIGLEFLCQTLKDGNDFYWWPVNENDPDLRVDKFLVNSQMLEKLKETGVGETVIVVEKPRKISCWEMLGCFSTYPEEEVILEQARSFSSQISIKSKESLKEIDYNDLDEIPLEVLPVPKILGEGLNERYFKTLKLIEVNYPLLEFIKKKDLSRRRFDQLINSRECLAIQNEKEMRDQ